MLKTDQVEEEKLEALGFIPGWSSHMVLAAKSEE